VVEVDDQGAAVQWPYRSVVVRFIGRVDVCTCSDG
jgi:hypothetical protein